MGVARGRSEGRAATPDDTQSFGIITIDRFGIINDDASPELFAALSQQRLRPEEAVAVCISRVLSLVRRRLRMSAASGSMSRAVA